MIDICRKDFENSSFEINTDDSYYMCDDINTQINELLSENEEEDDSYTYDENSDYDESSSHKRWYILDSVPFCKIEPKNPIKLFKISNKDYKKLIDE